MDTTSPPEITQTAPSITTPPTSSPSTNTVTTKMTSLISDTTLSSSTNDTTLNSTSIIATTAAKTTTTTTPTTLATSTTGPIITKRPKAKYNPYTKPTPILLIGDRRSRKRKSLTWLTDDKIQKVHYFEFVPDERINVTRLYNADNQQNDANASAVGSSLNANNKLPNTAGSKISNASVDPIKRSSSGKTDNDKCIEYSPWRQPVLIDFTPELPSPGWNSIERSAQAERELYSLGAIDLPGQLSTLDEPDQQPKLSTSNGVTGQAASSSSSMASSAASSGATESSLKEGVAIKIIPLDNIENNGSYIEYPDMYTCEFVNGVRLPSDSSQQQQQQQQHLPILQNIAPFSNQQSQLLPNHQFQQQLVHATQNPFTFSDMGAQFQATAQMQVQFPFQHQQQLQAQLPLQPQQQQQQLLQQQQPQQQQQQQPAFIDQQTGLTGPIMPWLSYPFNQVNENSHAHLFRRPAT